MERRDSKDHKKVTRSTYILPTSPRCVVYECKIIHLTVLDRLGITDLALVGSTKRRPGPRSITDIAS